MKSAFSLVEILIVVSILGILAAIVIPEYQGHSLHAKEAAARTNLKVLREAIERYAFQHDGVPPGYIYGNPDGSVARSPGLGPAYRGQLVTRNQYLSELPKNPFNQKSETLILENGADFPSEPTQSETYGWIYQPQTKTIRLNYPGTDASGTRYFDY